MTLQSMAKELSFPSSALKDVSELQRNLARHKFTLDQTFVVSIRDDKVFISTECPKYDSQNDFYIAFWSKQASAPGNIRALNKELFRLSRHKSIDRFFPHKPSDKYKTAASMDESEDLEAKDSNNVSKGKTFSFSNSSK